MTLIKYFSLLILSFFLTFSLTFFVYYKDIKSAIEDEFIQKSKNVEIYMKEFITNNVKDNNYKKIEGLSNSFINMDIVKKIDVDYKRYIFTKKALLLNSNKINSSKYRLNDVTTDIKSGKVVMIDDTTYEFIPDIYFDMNQEVIVKFLAFSENEVFSSTSTLKFAKISIQKKEEEQNSTSGILGLFTNFDSIEVEKGFSIEYEKQPYVVVNYLLDKTQAQVEMESMVKKIFIYSMSIFFVSIFILYFFYLKIVKKDIEKPIGKIQEYVDDILNNQFIRLEKVDTKLMHIDEIFGKLKLLSKKVASLTNEANINKELLAKKDFTDEITGLANKKVFDRDMKNLFVTNNDAYIILWKIDKLGEFVSKNGSNDANNLIKDFGHSLVQLLKRYPKFNSNVYRFYGAEFAVIIQMDSLEQLQTILKTMTENLQQTLKSRYLIDGKVFHCGATPFDQYGTVDSILHNAHETYLKSLTSENLFVISDNAELVEKTREYERTVKDIIEREDFTIKFIFDTFEMDSEKLIMQDASPLIIDSETFEKFPIGVFISVAEKLKISSDFDKIVIQKVLSYLEYEKLAHQIVINLSIQSLTDRKFLSWLEGQLLYNDIAKHKLIFSITSYNAKENIVKFQNLVDIIHKFESKVMLKRFSLEDFSTEELDNFEKLDYIRLSKEYCQEVDQDRVKKHAVKNIILYGEMNDIYVLGDSIKSDNDYKTMSRLGLYATSR